MQARLSLRGMPIFATALAGVFTGHWAAYARAVPDPHERLLVLRNSGHGYVPLAGKLAMILLLVGLGTVVARRLASGAAHADDGHRGLAALVARLWAVQVAAFAVLEVTERAASGAPLGGLMQHRLLVVGLGIQLAVAAIGALLLRAADRAGAGLASISLRRRLPRPIAAFRRSLAPGPAPFGPVRGATGARGPPSA